MPALSNRAQHTANTVRVYRQIGLAKKPRKRLPASIYPSAIEREYARAIRSLIREVHAALGPLLLEVSVLVKSAEADRRVDSMSAQIGSCDYTLTHGAAELGVLRMDIGESKKVRELAELVREKLKGQINTTRIESIVEKFATRTSAHQRVQLAKQIKAALGIDIGVAAPTVVKLIDGWVQVNVSKIKNLPEEIISGVEDTISNGVQRGLLTREVAKQISTKFAVNEKRAARIARDQIATLTGQITSARHQEIGVRTFIWRSVGDERVRPLHRRINGLVYRYPGGHPSEGIPGEPVNCRCYPEPVFDNILRGV